MAPSRRWISRLKQEMAGWVQSGLIGPQDRARLEAHYAAAETSGRLIATVLTLGAVLTGLGVILFVASNWQAMGPLVKFAIIVAAIVGFNAAGWRLREGPAAMPKAGEALFLCGGLVYGAGLWLVAQMFHLPYNHADSVLAWLAGLLPLVWLLRSTPLLVLASLLAPAWLLVLCASPWSSDPWSYLFLDDVQRSGLYRYLPLAGLLLWLAARHASRAAFVVSVAGLLIWAWRWFAVQLDPLPLVSDSEQLLYGSFTCAMGLAMYAAGALWRGSTLPQFAGILRTLGLVLLFGGNLVMTFVSRWSSAVPVPDFTAAMAAILLLLLGAGWTAAKLDRRLAEHDGGERPGVRVESRAVLLAATLQIIALFLSALGPAVMSIGFNMLLAAEILVFLVAGFQHRDEAVFRVSLWGFGLLVLARYFDTFWRLLPRSLFFLVGGVLLVAGGLFLERQHKQALRNMRGAS